MGALPKRKTSHARTAKRRSHLGVKAPVPDQCPQCHNPKLSHRVCPTCGTYNGREVIKVEGSKRKPG